MEMEQSSRVDRKTVEKNRRIHMKTLYSKLSSLIPKDPNSTPKEVTLLPDQLQNAANYIRILQENIEKMKEKKDSLTGIDEINQSMNEGMTMDLQSPYIEIQDLGSALMVVLISGLDNHNMFYQSIRILEEEGAEVVNASFSVVGDKVFHTIHSMVPDPKVGFEATNISKRLRSLSKNA
ncbi:transcription factor bHLH162-like [Magnolia sinica]|uniref:transcription factor bHLH162-like n=1 Tax=Magnolia sinica TaxID=86752 RepID=UPI002657E8B4|nr:transcription factor bHLH162-like [Magnolia sinica]